MFPESLQDYLVLIEGSYFYFINIQFSYRQSKFPSSFSAGNANLILEIQLNLKGENMKIADAITYCLQYHKINSRERGRGKGDRGKGTDLFLLLTEPLLTLLP